MVARCYTITPWIKAKSGQACGGLGTLKSNPELVEITEFMLMIIVGRSLTYHSYMAKAARIEYISLRNKICGTQTQ